MKLNRLLSFLPAITFCFTADAIAADNVWDWSIEPYLLAANIDGDATVGRTAGSDVAVDPSDIFEHLELGLMLHAEALNHNGWGVMMDYAYMRLGDELSGPVGGVTKATIGQGVFEAFVFRRYQHNNNHFDIYGGVRWWDNDLDVDISTPLLPGSATADIEEDWVDPVIGARYFHTLNTHWTLTMQGDVGGFGVASDSSYLLALGATYQINESWKLDLKYKGLWVDYENGTPGTRGYYQYDTITHGPVIGFIYDF